MKKFLIIVLLISCFKTFKNANSNYKDLNQELILSINSNNVYRVKVLIEAGANINYIMDEKSILDLALDNKSLDIIKILVEKGVEISRENAVRIYELSLDTFNYKVIDLIKDKYKLEKGLVDNNKYFLFLCYSSDLEKIKKFIKKNCIKPKEIFDNTNTNALIIAVYCNKLDIVKMLIEEYKFDINHKNNNGCTALMFASEKGNLEIVKLLIERGADINQQDNQLDTALIKACRNGYKEIIELLIEKSISINEKGCEGWTPLMIASQNGYLEIVKILIEKGANIDDKNNYGITALIIALSNNRIEVAKKLINQGADIDFKTKDNNSPLILACGEGLIESVELLINKGANLYFDIDLLLSILSYKLKSEKEDRKLIFFRICYLLFQKIKDDCIKTFMILNKANNHICLNEVKEYINLCHLLLLLPKDIFIEVIKNIN